MKFPCCNAELPAPLNGVAKAKCSCGTWYDPKDLIQYNKILTEVKRWFWRGGNTPEPVKEFTCEKLATNIFKIQEVVEGHK